MRCGRDGTSGRARLQQRPGTAATAATATESRCFAGAAAEDGG